MAFYTESQWVDWVDQLADKDYVVVDNFLPQEHYKTLRSFFLSKLEENDFNKAGIGMAGEAIVNKAIRGDYTYWLDQAKDVELVYLFELLDSMKNDLNRFCYLSLSGYEFHLAHYPQGSFYKKHLDQFKERNNRIITFLLYLNEGWQKGDGGELKIHLENEEQIIEPLANRCILFKSDALPHEVLQTNVSRYSLTGWFTHLPSSLGYLLG